MTTSHTVFEQLSDNLTSITDLAASRVVQVGTPDGRPATGTVFAPERILVAAHGVDRDSRFWVRHGAGDTTPAEFLGADPATGLAVLRVAGLASTPLEAAAGVARAGQLVVALGRTWSGALAASVGVVSVVGGPLRTGRGRAIEQVVRADVTVHPFGAGGPLVGAGGQAVAIATGARLRGLPLFIPSAAAWAVGESIAAHGSTKRGYLGVSAHVVQIPERLRAGRAWETGLLVVAAADGSPAEQGGVILGDVLVGFDHEAIADQEALQSMLAGERVGKTVRVEIIRGGAMQTLQVTVGERA